MHLPRCRSSWVRRLKKCRLYSQKYSFCGGGRGQGAARRAAGTGARVSTGSAALEKLGVAAEGGASFGAVAVQFVHMPCYRGW